MAMALTDLTGDPKGIQGSKWTYKLYFDPRADKTGNDIEKVGQKFLVLDVLDLVDNEDIICVHAYKNALLCDLQPTKTILYHAFIVFETDYWWWSIEKNETGITLQRAKKIESVRDNHLKERRTQYKKIELIEKDNTMCKRTISRLIQLIYCDKELNDRYDILQSNCKHFADNIFEYLSKDKNLELL